MLELAKFLAIGLATLCGLTAATTAGFDEGMIAFERGAYETAYRVLKPFAERGDPRAQSTLGLLYARGTGVPKDYDAAFVWYRKAAAQGDAQGQFGLGYMYSKGLGVAQDYEKAVRWFNKSAVQGFAPGQFGLAFMYAMGTGAPRDDVRAHMWFSLAAGQGHPDAGILRDRIARNLSPTDLSRARQLVYEWLTDNAW